MAVGMLHDRSVMGSRFAEAVFGRMFVPAVNRLILYDGTGEYLNGGPRGVKVPLGGGGILFLINLWDTTVSL